MDIQTTKIELARFILDSQNADLISKIRELIQAEQEDFWFELSNEQKEEIAISREQMRRGETQDWEALKKKLL